MHSNPVFTVSKKDSQASFGWQFIHEIEVMRCMPTDILAKAQCRFGDDPYLERRLGHYSSGFLLEISKQIGKATIMKCHPSAEETRFVVREIHLAFERYTILDTRYPLAVSCRIHNILYRKGKPLEGDIHVAFEQGGETVTVIRYRCLMMAAAMEARYEQRIRTTLDTAQRSEIGTVAAMTTMPAMPAMDLMPVMPEATAA